MIRTTDLKEKYIPIKLEGPEVYLINWGYTPFKEVKYKTDDLGKLILDEKGNPIIISETVSETIATWCSERLYIKPNELYIQSIIIKWYNDEIDKNILTGFKWKGYKVWLSQENQFNYKAAYDLAVQTGGANLPIRFKFGTDDSIVYKQFNTVEELADFYTSAMKFIQETLANGWKEKDAIDWNLYKI